VSENKLRYYLTDMLTYEHAIIPWVPYTAERRESNTNSDFSISNTKKKKTKESKKNMSIDNKHDISRIFSLVYDEVIWI
jgi:hypothetical protein